MAGAQQNRLCEPQSLISSFRGVAVQSGLCDSLGKSSAGRKAEDELKGMLKRVGRLVVLKGFSSRLPGGASQGTRSIHPPWRAGLCRQPLDSIKGYGRS